MGIGSYFVPTLLALLLHLGLVLLLIPHWFNKDDPYRKTPQHVQAQMIDLKALTNLEASNKPPVEEQKKKAEKRAQS